MENKSDIWGKNEITIDVTAIFEVLLSKIHIILATGIFTALAVFICIKLFITPMYESTTKVYVLSKDVMASITYSDLQTGTQLTKDYMELVKSRPVMEQVIAVLDLNMDVDTLNNRVTVETPADTRILYITVKDEDPKRAREIVNAIREAVGIQIMEVMDVDAVNTVEEGDLPTTSISPNIKRDVIIGGILGIFAATGIIILLFLLDDTLKTPEQVEQYLDLNVLATVPFNAGSRKSKKKSAGEFLKKSNEKRA